MTTTVAKTYLLTNIKRLCQTFEKSGCSFSEAKILKVKEIKDCKKDPLYICGVLLYHGYARIIDDATFQESSLGKKYNVMATDYADIIIEVEPETKPNIPDPLLDPATQSQTVLGDGSILQQQITAPTIITQKGNVVLASLNSTEEEIVKEFIFKNIISSYKSHITRPTNWIRVWKHLGTLLCLDLDPSQPGYKKFTHRLSEAVGICSGYELALAEIGTDLTSIKTLTDGVANLTLIMTQLSNDLKNKSQLAANDERSRLESRMDLLEQNTHVIKESVHNILEQGHAAPAAGTSALSGLAHSLNLPSSLTSGTATSSASYPRSEPLASPLAFMSTLPIPDQVVSPLSNLASLFGTLPTGSVATIPPRPLTVLQSIDK